MAISIAPKLLKLRRTKIVATLGPASNEREIIEALVRAGVDVFRLNMSHGSQETHAAIHERVRAAAAGLDRSVAVLADLCGPKIRVGRFPGGCMDLVAGSRVTITTRDVPGGNGLIPSQYRELADDLRPGDRVLLDDGNLELRVERTEGSEVGCAVVTGGPLKDHKGMNLPGVAVSAPSLTSKDRSDAAFAMGLGVDLLALSFVRRAADVEELRALVEESGSQAGIVAKIEKPEALDDIDAIMERADAIMVARGDLGVELPPQAVPLAQDQLVDLARCRAVPVIVATQMLESMLTNPRPTRAEVSDVATAVRSGADAVMLSGETAVGRYPVKAVEMMDTVVRQTEAYQWQQGAFGSLARTAAGRRPDSYEQALAVSMAQLSRDLRVRCIVVLTMGGHSARIMSAARPAAPLVTVFPDETARRKAHLLWGTLPLAASAEAMEAPTDLVRLRARELGFAEPGQTILVVRGFSTDPHLNTPSITVMRV